MKPSLPLLSILLFAFLSINMTCNQTPTAQTDCIDESKINKNAACTMEYIPVCGCDGKTYGNKCMAKNAGLIKWTEGACNECIDVSKINPNAACTREYVPVCGCDEKTYSNKCVAKNAGLTKWTEGACNDCIDASKINPSAPCTKEYRPVCGCDEKTYGNKCMAKNAGLKSWTPGKCKTENGDTGCIDESKINPDAPCILIYKPVCGCDNKTYGNSCQATNAGVTKWVDGECGETPNDGCIDRSKIVAKDCPDEYDPVCGCNGRTYPNSCSAEISGVLKWVDGKCK